MSLYFFHIYLHPKKPDKIKEEEEEEEKEKEKRDRNTLEECCAGHSSRSSDVIVMCWRLWWCTLYAIIQRFGLRCYFLFSFLFFFCDVVVPERTRFSFSSRFFSFFSFFLSLFLCICGCRYQSVISTRGCHLQIFPSPPPCPSQLSQVNQEK